MNILGHITMWFVATLLVPRRSPPGQESPRGEFDFWLRGFWAIPAIDFYPLPIALTVVLGLVVVVASFVLLPTLVTHSAHLQSPVQVCEK